MHARMQLGHAQVSCMRAACMRAFVRRVQRRCLLRCWHQARCRHPKRSQDQKCTTRGRSACHHQASCRCQIEFCTAASKFHCDSAALLQLLYRVEIATCCHYSRWQDNTARAPAFSIGIHGALTSSREHRAGRDSALQHARSCHPARI